MGNESNNESEPHGVAQTSSLPCRDFQVGTEALAGLETAIRQTWKSALQRRVVMNWPAFANLAAGRLAAVGLPV